MLGRGIKWGSRLGTGSRVRTRWLLDLCVSRSVSDSLAPGTNGNGRVGLTVSGARMGNICLTKAMCRNLVLVCAM